MDVSVFFFQPQEFDTRCNVNKQVYMCCFRSWWQ